MALIIGIKKSVKTALRPSWRFAKSKVSSILGKDTLSVAEHAKLLKSTLVSKAGRTGDVKFIPYGKSDIFIAVTEPQVSALVQDRVTKGHYEVAECRMCEKILEANEVVVELGSGLGLISTTVMKTGRAKEIHCFEADQRLIHLIQATHKKNGVKNSFLYNAAVTGDRDALNKGEMTFHLRENFWGNSTNPNVGKTPEFAVQVKTRSLKSIMMSVKPTIIIADIEGAELGLFTDVDLTGVKRILLEVHPFAIGASGMRSVFDDLHKAGFYYDPRFSSGTVPGFSRG
jgi:FkbM family methyltransferase